MKKTKTIRRKTVDGRRKTAVKGRAVKRKHPKKAPKKKAVKLPPGRPTVCTEAAALVVLQRIMEGDCLERACGPEDVPCKRTWLRWVAVDVSLQSRYVAAMQIRALSRADECVPIADEVREEKGAVLKANLRIRTRQWEIQRLANKVYGKDGVIEPPPSPAGDHTAMSDPEVELRLKSLREELKGKR
jgi:hypothetical protein